MVRFPILLASTSLACFSTIVAAQSPQTNLEAEKAEKDQRTPAPEPGRRPGDPIVVIGRKVAGEVIERAERYQARQIRDLFDADPSVEIAGGSRNGQRLFLRGIEGSNLNITVDGARQGQNLYNHRGGLQNIDPEILKRVEIQPGPSAADQGFGALGGAIRFETVDAQDRLVEGRRIGVFARAGYGSAAESKRLALAAYGLISDEIGIIAYGTGTDFNNIRVGGGQRLPFSGGKDRTALVKLTIKDLNGHSLRIGYEYNDADGLNYMQRGDYPWQLQPIDPRARPPQDQSLTRDTATLRYRYDPENALINIQLNAYSNRNDFFAPNSNGERFISKVTGGDLRNVFDWAIGEAEASTSVGVEWVRDRGTALRSDQGAFYNRNENFGQFVQQRIKTDLFSLGAGVRRDDYTADYGPRRASGAVWSFNASGEIRPVDGLSLGLAWGEATRGAGNLPVHFARNVRPGLTFNGSPTEDLRPERSSQVEASARLSGIALGTTGFVLSGDVSWYQTRIKDAILYFQPGSGGLGGRPITNIFNWNKTIRFTGWEGGLGVASRNFASNLRFSTVDIRDMPPEPQFIARTGAPRGDQWVWDNRAAIGDRLTFGYTLRVTGRLSEVPAGQIVYIPKPGFTLHDVQMSYRLPTKFDALLDLAVTNLTDKEYVAHSTLTQNGLGTQDPGRDIRVSLVMRY
jgi:hemoglobin/transferrin/lactoferrin receptor protein